MGLIIVYKRMTEKELRKAATEATTQILDWFEANPRRKICRAELMYGRHLKVTRGQVVHDIQLFVQALLKEDQTAAVFTKAPAKKRKKKTAANYGQDDGRNTTEDLLPR
jgi:chaperone required for assembly of F1-ATPase